MPEEANDQTTEMIGCSSVNFRWPTAELDTTPVLENISFSIKRGEFVSIIGASGCGKSTLLNILAGVRQADSGHVTLKNKIISQPNKDIGLVFQNYGLFSWLNIQENIEFGMKINGWSKKERSDKAKNLLEQIHLIEDAKKYPHQLSGGMRQRVAIMRALANEPEVILMDEPFGALDYLTRKSMNDLLISIWEKTKKTIIFVTHDINESILLSDRVILMSSNPGRIESILDIGLARPRDEKSTEFYHLQEVIHQHLRLNLDYK